MHTKNIGLIENSITKVINFLSTNDILPSNIFIIKQDGTVIWANDRMLSISNENLQSIQGKNIDMFGEVASEGIKRVLDKKMEELVEEEWQGNHFITCRYPIIAEGGDIEYIIGISLNVTKIKQAETKKEKQASLQDLAHDLRVPLAGIIGVAHIQEMGLDTIEASKEYGQMIHSAGNQLLELLNAVINTVDTKHITDPTKVEPLDLSALAKEMQALMTPSTLSRGLHFQLKIDENLPIVLSNRIKLKRILINLLSNAVKFTKVGEVGLTIKLLSIEANQTHIEIHISDTGIGIAKDKLDKIFNRRYQVHTSHLTEDSGFGLGLHLVEEGLKELNGCIKVYSEEGKGSQFILYFKFPLQENLHKTENKGLPLQSETVAKSTHKGTILIAEDNTIARLAAKNFLERLGYKITEAIDGKAALAALKNQLFSWALLDMGLLELKGTEVCKQYRQWEKEMNKPYLPIFVLTGHSEESVAQACKEAGADKVFTKPLTQKIIQAIEALTEVYLDKIKSLN